MAKFYIVKELPAANKHLPFPLKIGEIVMRKDDENLNSQYISIYHNEGKNKSIFYKSYFKRYLPKDKVETVSLIKKKGKLPENEES